MKAKTFDSRNHFTGPQSLSNFGIEIDCQNEKKSLGLEELNGIPLLIKNKLAYLPAFSSDRFDEEFELDLFFSRGGNTWHYGTMRGVKQIKEEEVPELRKQLENLPEIAHECISNAPEFNLCIEYVFKIWKRNFDTNTILEKKPNDRFIVNVHYKEFTFLPALRNVQWTDFRHASILYY